MGFAVEVLVFVFWSCLIALFRLVVALVALWLVWFLFCELLFLLSGFVLVFVFGLSVLFVSCWLF